MSQCSIGRRTLLLQSLLGGAALAGAGFSEEAAAQSTPNPRDATFRRVVTANNAQGKSYFLQDEVVKRGPIWSHSGKEKFGPGAAGDLTALLPTSVPAIEPPAGGANCFFAIFPPSKKKKGEPIERVLGNGAVGKDGFHRTATIDYQFIVDGEVTLYLDEGETTLHPGDIVIQRNTAHAWQNYGSTPMTLISMMVSA